MREAFRIFDSDGKGAIKLEMVKEILDLLGHEVDDEELEEVMEGLFAVKCITKTSEFNFIPFQQSSMKTSPVKLNFLSSSSFARNSSSQKKTTTS